MNGAGTAPAKTPLHLAGEIHFTEEPASEPVIVDPTGQPVEAERRWRTWMARVESTASKYPFLISIAGLVLALIANWVMINREAASLKTELEQNKKDNTRIEQTLEKIGQKYDQLMQMQIQQAVASAEARGKAQALIDEATREEAKRGK